MRSQKHIKITLWMEFLFNSSFLNKNIYFDVDSSSIKLNSEAALFFQVCQSQQICSKLSVTRIPLNASCTIEIMYNFQIAQNSDKCYCHGTIKLK